MIEYQSPAAEETLNEGYPAPHAAPVPHMAPIDSGQPPLIEVRRLKQVFPVPAGLFRTRQAAAVDDVSFVIRRGESLGIVGESGCGKSVLGRTLLRLYEPAGGEILYNGRPVETKKDLREYRKKAAMVFQDARAALNPRMTVSDIIGEPLDIHRLYAGQAREKRILDLLEKAGLHSGYAARYAHQLSLEEARRVGIARALSLNPDFLICDDPVRGLDVSAQARLINLFDDLRDQISLLFLARDIRAARHLCRRTAVMCGGKLVELADAGELCGRPLHPCTRLILSAAPQPDPRRERVNRSAVPAGGSPSSLEASASASSGASASFSPDARDSGYPDAPSGCPFRVRCPHATEPCGLSAPEFREVSTGHFCACHRAEQERAIP